MEDVCKLRSRHESLRVMRMSPAAIFQRLTTREHACARYVVRDEIGRGGQGAVFEVWDKDLRRPLAMKLAHEHSSTPKDDGQNCDSCVQGSMSLSRFLDEAQVTGQLDHPAIVPVHELGLDAQGRFYFTMKLVQGDDLAHVYDLVHEGRQGWTQTRAVGVLVKVCEAMAYAHHKGVVHRDLKPSNVMVGSFGAVYVMDWGIARVSSPEASQPRAKPPPVPPARAGPGDHSQGERHPEPQPHTLAGDVVGTPAYMSPEQARGDLEKVGPQSDVYAVGAMLYHLLTGQMPFAAEGLSSSLAVWAQVQSQGPRPVHELAQRAPAELIAICEKAMARAIPERYGSVEALGDDLRAYLETRVVCAYETGAWAEARKWMHRNSTTAFALAAAALMLLLGTTASLFSKHRADELALLARRNEAEALHQASLAEESARLAEGHFLLSEERRAAEEAQRLIAEARTEDVLRLSSLQGLEDLNEAEAKLWPASPELIPAYEAWLEHAQALTAELPRYVAKRESLRHLAQPTTTGNRTLDRAEHPRSRELDASEEQLASAVAAFDAAFGSGELESLAELELAIATAEERVLSLSEAVSEPWRWSFETEEDRWWHAQVTRLIDGLRSLLDEEQGLMTGTSPEFGWGIERRLAFARTVEERTISGPEARERWERACESIADPDECPAYAGLVLRPQLGLLPLARDPSSGLWEFWHVQSGSEPGRSAHGELVLEEETGIVLVLLPAGTFVMGAQRDDPAGPNYDPLAQADEWPVHTVSLSAFFLSKYEMTQGQWKRFAASNPSFYGPDGQWAEGYWSRTQIEASLLQPVEQVSWEQAEVVLRRLSLELPTEAQWEYGARAGTQTPWWTGNEAASLAGAANLSDSYRSAHGGTEGWPSEAWDDGYTVHAPVGSWRPNGFGLHDVVGNVWEWCRDGYAVDSYATSAESDPLLEPEHSDTRVFRGGSFSYIAGDARSSIRYNLTPAFADNSLGLRPARAVE